MQHQTKFILCSNSQIQTNSNTTDKGSNKILLHDDKETGSSVTSVRSVMREYKSAQMDR